MKTLLFSLRTLITGSAILVALLYSQPVQAADYVVDTLSSEEINFCTESPDDCSLAGAINNANLNPGPDSITFLPGLSGTIYSPPQGFGFQGVYIDTNDTEDCHSATTETNHLTVTGLGHFDGSDQPIFPIVINGENIEEDWRGCFELEGSFHEVSGLAFTNCRVNGVKMLSATCSNVSNNHFYTNGDKNLRNVGVAIQISQGDYGISKANTVSDNLIEDSQNSALNISQGSMANLVTNNIIKDTTGPLDNNHGLEVAASHYNIISDNTLLNNEGDGMGIGGTSTHNKVIGNTINNCDLTFDEPERDQHSDSIHLNVGPSFNTIEGNVFRCSYENAIHVGGDPLLGPIKGNVIRNNLVIDAGTKYPPDGPPPTKHNGIAVDGAAHNTLVEENIVHGSTGYGVRIDYSAFNATPNSVEVKDNVLYDNADSGISINGQTFSFIHHNVIYGNGFGISTGAQDFWSAEPSHRIVNNTIYGNQYDGIGIMAAINVEIKNNIISHNGEAGISKRVEGAIIDHTYNNFYDNPIGAIHHLYKREKAGSLHETEIEVDPQFVSPEENDFHLQSQGGHWTSEGWVKDSATSECIDAGDPEDDFSQELTPNGNRINLGAYGNTSEASLTYNCMYRFRGMGVVDSSIFCKRDKPVHANWPYLLRQFAP